MVQNKLLIITTLVVAVYCTQPCFAGTLDAAGVPASGSSMPTTTDIYNRLDTGADITVPSSFKEPASGPTSGTGKSLADIMGKLPVADNVNGAAASEVTPGKTFWGLRTDGTWGATTGTQINYWDCSQGMSICIYYCVDNPPPGTGTTPSMVVRTQYCPRVCSGMQAYYCPSP